MINKDIISKIKDNVHGDLSIMELKELYRPDALLYPKLGIGVIYYIRDIYQDLSKLYGEEFVAHTPDELNENTICYVGDLDIIKILPTYNLK